MKKRIAMVLALMATVSTLGSNAVMARYDPICTHPQWENWNINDDYYVSDGEETHTHYERYEVYCTVCGMTIDRYSFNIGSEEHSFAPVTTVLYTEENPDGTYAFYETIDTCCCGQTRGDPIHEYQPYP